MFFQIDTKVSFGNILTLLVIVFTAGGTYYSIRQGQKVSNDRLDSLAEDIKFIKQNYTRTDLDEANAKLMMLRMSQLEDRMKILEESPRPRRTH